MLNGRLIRILMLLSIGWWLAGCVQTKTTPGYARAGDHIVIGLGGVERNVGGEAVLRASDLTITIDDASGNPPYPLEPRFVFKTYLEYAAQMNTYTFDGTNALAGLSGMVPYDGGWFVVAPLTYPGQYDNPLPLTVGPATISVTSPKLANTADDIEGDQTAIPIEIIAGTSAQDTDFVRQFYGYISTPNNFIISPDDLTGVSEVAGAYIVIDYIDDTFFENGLEPLIVPGNNSPYVQLNYKLVSNGNGTGTIYATLLNPAGFRDPGTGDPNSSLLSDLDVKLVYFSTGTPAAAKANFSINTSDSYYIDMNGIELTGIEPVLTHSADL